MSVLSVLEVLQNRGKGQQGSCDRRDVGSCARVGESLGRLEPRRWAEGGSSDGRMRRGVGRDVTCELVRSGMCVLALVVVKSVKKKERKGREGKGEEAGWERVAGVAAVEGQSAIGWRRRQTALWSVWRTPTRRDNKSSGPYNPCIVLSLCLSLDHP